MATTSYYAGAGDAQLQKVAIDTWANVHDAASGDVNTWDKPNGYIMGDRLSSSNFYIGRLTLPIDTSGIGSEATISAATLHVFTAGGQGGAENIYLVASTQADPTTPAGADYSRFGTTSLKSGGGSVSIDGATTGTDVSIILDSPDTNVSKTGYTKLGLREYDHDVANVQATNDKYQVIALSETADTSNDPYISVTYEAAGGTVNAANVTSKMCLTGVGC